MRSSKLVQSYALSLAAMMAFGAQATIAAGPVAAGKSADVKMTAPAVTDVALQDGGVLAGQVVNPKGAPQAHSQVRLLQFGQEVATVVADDDGRFVVRGLRGGVHEIQTAESTGVYGLWASGTAPPSARTGAITITNSTVVRGQSCCDVGGCGKGGCGCGIGSPFLRGALVGTLVTGVVIWAADHNPTGS